MGTLYLSWCRSSPYGAVLNKPNADEFLGHVTEKNRGLMRANLTMTGWKDAGDHFSISAASKLLPGLVSIFEAEQLLLAPDGWVPEQLSMFGLHMEGTHMLEHSYAYAGAGPELTKTPLLRYWGGSEEDTAISKSAALVKHQQRSSSGKESTSLSNSADNDDSCRGFNHVFQSYPVIAETNNIKLSSAAYGSGKQYKGIGHAWSWKAQPDKAGLVSRHSKASKLLRDLGPIQKGSAGVSLSLCTPDGMPILGFHPGFENGRVAVACTGTSGDLGEEVADLSSMQGGKENMRSQLVLVSDPRRPLPEGSRVGNAGSKGEAEDEYEDVFRGTTGDGYQLSPVLARFASDLLCGAPIQDIEPGLIDLARKGINAVHVPATINTWDGGLYELQDGSFYNRKTLAEIEEEAHNAEELRRATEE
eukprot:gene28775-31962_t